MNKFTAAFTFLFVIGIVGAASRNPIFRVQLNEDDNKLIVEDPQPIVEVLEDSQNAITRMEEDASTASVTTTGASQFINPNKAPSSPFQYMMDALYGILSEVYEKVFG